MRKKIIIFTAILIITIFGLFFSGKNLVFAVDLCTDALTCDTYCFNSCREDPANPGNTIGLNSPAGRFCLCNPWHATTVDTLIESVTNFILYLATVVYPLMVIFAAFLFMTAAGNPSNIEKAKSVLIFSSVGYGIIILANALVYVIKSVIGG
ncbi:MAG: pilin [Candidatus Nealsonbacteria bacterium]|nr:pilin [Candidatus Nealsonbacteria bacterium]